MMKLLGGWQMYLISGALLLTMGFASGGWIVHKFYQAGEVANLKQEIARRDKADKDRARVVAELAAANQTRENQLVATIEGLEAHAESLMSCPVSGDVGRLLNSHR